MAKDTVLAIVQNILGDADGDLINSISDTVESLQCADVVKDSFDQIVEGYDLALHNSLQKLTATSSTTPTVMERPEGFYNIQWVKYDSKNAASDDQAYVEVHYVDADEFMRRTSRRALGDSTIEAMTLADSGHIVLVHNDKAPTYYTQLDGYDDLVFDAYDKVLESNLQNSKSLAYGSLLPTLSLTDGAVPNLPKHLTVLLKRESRAMYFDLYKDGVTSEIDRTRRRAEVRAQRHRHMIKNTDNTRGPNYGRK